MRIHFAKKKQRDKLHCVDSRAKEMIGYIRDFVEEAVCV